jgi:hypothetical protein
MVLLSATIGSVAILAKLATSAIRYCSRLPRGVLLLMYACLVGILFYQPTRERLLRICGRGRQALMIGAAHLVPRFLELAQEAEHRRASASRRWSAIAPFLRSRHIPISAHVLAVCAAARRPLTFEEVLDRLNRLGARTTAPTFRNYLRSVLRNHPRLERTADAAWRPLPSVGHLAEECTRLADA